MRRDPRSTSRNGVFPSGDFTEAANFIIHIYIHTYVFVSASLKRGHSYNLVWSNHGKTMKMQTIGPLYLHTI